jgi:mono/diheme cytochrome c family protein
MLAVMVFVCTTLGWVLTKVPRRAKSTGPAIAQAKAPAPERKAQPSPEPPRPREKAPTPPAKRAAEEPRPRPEPERPAVPPPEPAGERMVLTYETHILPIMQRSCISCHGDRKKRGGLDLRTLASLKRGGDSGAGVKPGDPASSPLLESIVSGQMPPGKRKLSDAEKQLIREWIAGGAKGKAGL